MVSVVVCTYNRSRLLPRAVMHLVRQTLPSRCFEILLVDNNSSDDTRLVAEALAAKHGNVRYVLEPTQGLSTARNRGVEEARGEYVAFIDDDALAPPDWLERAVETIRGMLPQPLVVGGRVEPLFVDRKPSWFRKDLETYSWGDEDRILRPVECFYGSNLFIQRRLLEDVRGFNPSLGLRGDRLVLSEDNELFVRLWGLLGPDAEFWYSPRLRVLHMVPETRTTLRYQIRRRLAYGQTVAIRSAGAPYSAKISKLFALGFEMTWRLVAAVLLLPRARSMRHWTIADLGECVWRAAAILALFGIRIRYKQA